MAGKELLALLEYRKNGISPNQYKIKTTIHANNSIKEDIRFELNKVNIILYSIQNNEKFNNIFEGYMPAFKCEVISSIEIRRDKIECYLETFFTFIRIDYVISASHEQWEEYDGKWYQSPTASSSMCSQNIYEKLQNNNIYNITTAFNSLSNQTNKCAKKVITIRKKLKEALKLEKISKNYSFLSYYSVLEIIANDLCSEKDSILDNEIAHEMAIFSLASKGSQRAKVFFLLKSIEHNFDISKSVELAEIRNDLSHSDREITDASFELCKEIAFVAAEQFLLHLQSNIQAR